MSVSRKNVSAPTAEDLMTRDVVTVPRHLPAAEAAQILVSRAITGVPVVDEENRCLGVFCATDFARLAHILAGNSPQPIACPFQLRHRSPNGTETTMCTLAPGMCLLQQMAPEEGATLQLCTNPHEVVSDWTMLQPAITPTDPVERWMTAKPITVGPQASMADCAARMLEARIHHLIVVDEARHVLGILTSTDLLRALARSQTGFHTESARVAQPS